MKMSGHVNELFLKDDRSGIPSMYICLMHYLNFFLSCSLKKVTLASGVVSIFTIKRDGIFPFYKF